MRLATLLAVVSSAATAQPVLFSDSYAVRPGDALDVDLGAEAVVVETGGTRATVTVEGRGADARDEFERRRFSARYERGRLVVRTEPQRRSGWSLRRRASFTVTIRIPERFDVDVNVGSGSVSVGSLDGSLAVNTGSGSVTLADVRGERITVDTGSGAIRAGRLTGDVSLDTGSGSVAVRSVRGSLDVGTGSGSVRASRVDGPANVRTGSGSVYVGLAGGADLAASGGRVAIDDALRFDGRRDRDGARGRIGGGGPAVRVGTGSGSITLAAAR